MIQLNPDRSRDQTSGEAILNESKAIVNKSVKDKNASVGAGGAGRSQCSNVSWGSRRLKTGLAFSARLPDIAV